MNYENFKFRERYNEVMYDERDIIEKFLKDQYDIRYGRQRDSWHFEPAVKMMNIYGNVIHITDVMLDKDVFVKFVGTFCNEKDEYECFYFAYGELSKVIEALPDANDIVIKNAVSDLSKFANNLRCDIILQESPFEFEDTKVDNVLNDDGGVHICVGGRVLAEENFSADFLSKLRDHINIEVLHRSNEYKELMELLSLEENMRFECQNYGDATFVIDGTDVTFDISSVRRDDKGCLVIYGNDIDADVCDNIELTEKDIKREYLVGIINEMKRNKYYDIMDTYNGHNPEFVRKINAAWKNKKYHDSFGDILYALACREMDEWEEKHNDIIHDSEDAMKHAHEIMEGVCDDQDLETILSFIRYED